MAVTLISKDGRQLSVLEPEFTYGIAIHDRDGNPLGVVHAIREGDNLSFEVDAGSSTVVLTVDVTGLIKELLPGKATEPEQVVPGKWKVNIVVDPNLFEITADNKLRLKEHSIDGETYLLDDSINGAKIKDGAIVTSKIADRAVIEEKIKSAIDLRQIDGVAMIPYATPSGELKGAYLKAGSGIKFRRLSDGGLELYLGVDAGTILSIVANEPLSAEVSDGVATLSLKLSQRFAVDSGVLELALGAISSGHINDYVILSRHIADKQIEERHIDDYQIKDKHITAEGLKSNSIEFVKTGTRIINAFFEYGALGWDLIGQWNVSDGFVPFSGAPSTLSVLKLTDGPYDDNGTPYFKGVRNDTWFRFNPFSNYDLRGVIRIDFDDINDVELYYAFWGYDQSGALILEPNLDDPDNDPKLKKLDLSSAVSGEYALYSYSGVLSDAFPNMNSEDVYSIKIGLVGRIKNNSTVIVDSLNYNINL